MQPAAQKHQFQYDPQCNHEGKEAERGGRGVLGGVLDAGARLSWMTWMPWGCVLDVLGLRLCPGCPGAFPGGVLDVLGVTRVYELNFKRYAQVPPSPNKLNSRLIKQPRPLALARAMAMCFVGGQWSSTQRGTRSPRLPGCPGCPGCVSWMPWGCVLDVLGGVLDVLGGVLDVLGGVLDVLDVRLLRVLDVLGPL